jgi:peptide subunit release factor 1 (eRF1)
MTLVEATRLATLPEGTQPTREVLARLSGLHAPGCPVVTCYIRLGPQDRIRTRYRLAVREVVHTARTAVDQPEVAHDYRTQVLRELDRIEDFLTDASRLPHAPGIGIFACEAIHLFEVVPLPRVLKTRLRVAERPQVAELLATVADFGRILVVAFDRTHARFFEVSPFAVAELSGLVAGASRGGKFHSDRADSPGTGERAFHGRIRQERHRLAAMVAQQATAYLAHGPWQGIVLAGPTRSLSDQMRFFSANLRERVLGVVRLNPTAVTDGEIRTAALRARAEWERRQEQAAVAELEEAIGEGWGVKGARPTLRALNRGQVRVLLAKADQTGYGFRCAASGRLALSRADCRGEGDPIPVADLMDEILEEALGQELQIVMIHDPESAAPLDGLGALLRFR